MALAEITLTFEDAYLKVRSFLHAEEILGYIEISGNKLPVVEIKPHDFTSDELNMTK